MIGEGCRKRKRRGCWLSWDEGRSNATVLASFPHRRFDRAEQPNKLHPFIFRRTSKGTARRRATVVGHCIRQRMHNQSALSLIDHDLVFVVVRHVPWSL